MKTERDRQREKGTALEGEEVRGGTIRFEDPKIVTPERKNGAAA